MLRTCKQFGSDIARNIGGLPEAGLTVGTSLLGQTGAGLGTLAGMTADVLRKIPDPGTFKRAIGGEGLKAYAPDVEAASEVIPDVAERFTYAPREEGGGEVLRGLETVSEPLEKGSQYVAEHGADTPLGQAAIYTGLNMLDPEMLLPAKATVQALRGAQRVARTPGASAPVTLKGGPGSMGQAGAWAPGDIADVPGEFAFRSPTVEAFNKLKPQEQKSVSGKQLMKALTREGASKEELQWMGLDEVLNTDEVLNVADVKQLAEANQPNIEHVQMRAKEGGGELDDEAVSEKARSMAWESDDLEYPFVARQRTGTRGRWEVLDTFDSQRDADRWIQRYREEYAESEKENLLSDIESHFTEEELADMDDDAREKWAESAAKENAETFDLEDMGIEVGQDTDSDPTNIDDLQEQYEREIRDNPEEYGLEGAGEGKPSWGEHTVGGVGDQPEAAYTAAGARLRSEARFGRGAGQTPEFLGPAMHEAELRQPFSPEMQAKIEEQAKTDPAVARALELDRADMQKQLSLIPEGEQSKAFQIEALRRRKVMQDPNREKYLSRFSEPHFPELTEGSEGAPLMYFTRETARNVPEWATPEAARNVGRQPGSEKLLRTPEGEELPALTEPSRAGTFVEEQQADLAQKGRKAGFAEPKGIEKIMKQRVDKEAQLEAFKQNAVAGLETLWTTPHVNDLITRLSSGEFGHNAATRIQELQAKWAELQPGGARERIIRAQTPEQREATGWGDTDQVQAERIAAGTRLLQVLESYGGGHESAPLIAQTRQALDMVEGATSMPGTSNLKPSIPLKETPQYMTQALLDSLRRAVAEGQQVFGWSDPDVHARRWSAGSESMQYAPDLTNPRQIRARVGSGRARGFTGRTVMDEQQAAANALFDPSTEAYQQADIYDLDDPAVRDKLRAEVRANLRHGMEDYPDPEAFIDKRTDALLEKMRESAKRAEAGASAATAEHYTPRGFGYESAYNPNTKNLIAALREAGVPEKDLPKVREWELEGRGVTTPQFGFEIDPEVAKAAKRGFFHQYRRK